jgi:tetratricopeptide (TPR) repeat protein/predicted AlkP superfamily phosphohydrolase/phosphomutase
MTAIRTAPASPSGISGRWRLAAIVAAPLAIVAAFALASIVQVPEGSHGYRRSAGAATWDLLDPGARLRIPLLHEFRVLPDEITIRRGSANSEAGKRAKLPASPSGFAYAVTARIRPEAMRLGAARGQTADEYLAANVEEILASAPGHGRTERLREELTRRGFDGLVVDADDGGGGGASRRTLEHPILLVGLDGADWQVAEPLIAGGRLPVLEGLRRRGAWGHMRSSMPMLSPLLWTTAATGKAPDEHGIIDFLVPDPSTGKKVPITSGFRRVRALWNIFGERGLFPSFVAWWATYPAEPLNGEIISDRVAYSLFDVGRPEAASSGLVYPPSLWSGVRGLILDPSKVPDGLITDLADVDGARIEAARMGIAAGGENASRDRLIHLMKIIASTESYHRIALDRLAAGQPDLLGVYYQGIDEISHRFAHCAPPALALCPAEDARRYGRTVGAFYEYQDRLLGELLDAADPDSFIVLVSDHGFRSGGDRPTDIIPDIDGKPAKWHRLYGIAVVAGPGIGPGKLDSATLVDITPTVLRLAGLPAARDMAGASLVGPTVGPAEVATVATYEGGGERLAVASTSPPAAASGTDAMLENLRSLGYIGDAEAAPPVTPAADGSTPSTVTAHTNVGSLHMQKGEIDEAEKEFSAALEIVPGYIPALMGLAEVRVGQNRAEEAFGLYRRALHASKDPEPGVYARFAALSTRLGRQEEAGRELGELRALRPGEAEIRTALALLAEERDDRAGAGELLEEALRVDPSSVDAMGRLFRIRREGGNEASLEPAIRKALSANPSSILHLNWLGLILERRGDARGAEASFSRALEIAPDFGGTMANLGSLYGRQGRLEEAVEVLSRALRIEPGNLESRVNLGASLGKLGRADEAVAILEEGRKQSPSSPEILNALAVAWAQKGNTARAVALFRESLGLREDQPRVRAMLAELQGGG